MSESPTFSAGRGYLLLGSMAFVIFLTVTAVAMLGPLLLDISSALGTTVPVAGQLVTVAAGTWGVTALLAGPFSDTYGRKPVLLSGTGLLAAGAVGIGLAPSFALATAGSVLVGIGGGMVPPTCIALSGDLFPEARRPMAIATLTTAPGLASALGVPLAAVLAEFAGWRVSFLVVGVALALAALPLLVLVPRQRARATALNLAGRLRWVGACPVTWHIAATNMMSRVTWGVLMTFLPAYLMMSYGLGTASVALPVAVVALWATAAPSLGGRIGRARRRLPMTAALLLAAALPGLGVFVLDWGLWWSVLAAGIFTVLVVPVTTILSILCAEAGGASRGTLAGVISSTNWGGTATGAAIGGVLVSQSGYGALTFLLVACVVGGGLLMACYVNDGALVRASAHFSTSPGTRSS